MSVDGSLGGVSEAKVREYVEHHPETTPIDVLGHFSIAPAHAAEVKQLVAAVRDEDAPATDADTDETDDVDKADESAESDASDSEGGSGYIDDPDFTGSTAAVREHYRRARRVFETLAELDGSPTTAAIGNSGWYTYRYEHELDIDELEAGYRKHRRAYTYADDFDELIEGIEADPSDSSWRTAYNIVSWKDAEAVRGGAYTDESGDFGGGDGLAGYSDMRGFGLWVDLDLEENDDDGDEGPNYKRRHGDLDAEHRETVEAAIDHYIDEFAEFCGVDREQIAALDSGGGAYLYAPPTATLPIAERYQDDDGPFGDARELLFMEFRKRMFAYATGTAVNASAGDYGFEGIQTRVNETVDGAAELLDPDWMQNRNRQSKAPLSIHGDHDIAVTPLRDDDGTIDYSPTLVSAVDDDVIEHTAAETSKITCAYSAEEREAMAEAVVSTLFAEYAEENGLTGWREILDAWLDDCREAKRSAAHAEAHDRRRQAERLAAREDTDETDPTSAAALAEVDLTPVRKDVHDALDSRHVVDVRDVIRDHACDAWDTSSRGHETTFDPYWRSSGSGQSCAVRNGENGFIDNKGGGGGPAKAYALGPKGCIPKGPHAAETSLNGKQWAETVDALRAEGYPIPIYIPEQGAERSDGETYDQTPLWALRKAAVTLGIVEPDGFVEVPSKFEDGETFRTFPSNETYNQTLAALDERGIDHGREPRTGTGRGGGGRYIEECEPPADATAEPLDVQARRDDMEYDAYARFIHRGELTIWAHNPGEGKTTSGSLGAANHERKFVVALPKHENCREFQTDKSKPPVDFHLKGAAQPVGNECMDADVDDRHCADHGHGSNCPSMCPVYDLDPDEPIRILFDALASLGKSRKAHSLLGLYDRDWHGESCEWLDQWSTIENIDRIVTVHNYLTMKTVREHGDILIDDAAGSFASDETVSIEALTRCRAALRRHVRSIEDERIADASRLLQMFIDELTDALAGASDDDEARAAIDELDVPEFPTTTRTFDTREEIPDLIDERTVYETRRKVFVGEGGQYRYETGYEAGTYDLAETLAQVRRVYEEVVLGNMREGEFSGTPMCLDAVYGALARVSDNEYIIEQARVAAGIDGALETCPACDSHLAPYNGMLVCTECGWDEDDRLVPDDATPARIDVDVATGEDDCVVGLDVQTLPPIAALPNPEDVLILDATPETGVYAAVFGVDPETVAVEGNDAYTHPHMNTTMFADGAYHLSTMKQSAVARKKIQDTIDHVDAMHDDVVYVAPRKAIGLFDWPDGTEPGDVLYYYALRGLDAHREADAIVLIGAPHPDENDIRAEGRLLSINNPGVEAGGREFSTRSSKEDDPNDNPGGPVYRKLNYVDEEGKGREVAAKTYSGIVGDLFDSRHAAELEQAAHRIRPLLADEDNEKHIYLLTNVPTRLPIDELTTFEDFLDPSGSAVDVRDSSRELLEAMVDAARDAENDAPYATDGGILSVAGTTGEWQDAAEWAGLDMAERTLYSAIEDLREAGLVEEGDYAQHRGRLKRITRRGASLVSVTR